MRSLLPQILRLGGCILAAAAAGCSLQPMLGDVISQANSGGKPAYDVVNVDDSVISTIAARRQPPFKERFTKYQPPAELKIAVGDTVSVVIWEAAANGLFGNSLTELTMPAGASAQVLTGQVPATPAGVPTRPTGSVTGPEILGLMTGLPPSDEERAAERSSEVGTAENANEPEEGAEKRRLQPQPNPPANTAAALRETFASKAQAEEGKQLSDSELDALVTLAMQSGRAGTSIPDQIVGSDEAISIPYAGRIAVVGRTPSEVQKIIETQLAGRALEPQALVVVKRSAANSVSVAGEIVGGKRIELSPGGDRLLQVIAAAGGAEAPVHETFVRLSRGGVTATLSLASLVADPAQDIYAEPGDVLTLERRRQTYSVFGATGKNATITFPTEHLSLAEALAKAGGLLDDRADPRAVFVFRYEPRALVRALGRPIVSDAPPELSPIVYRLDLREAHSYLLAQRFQVRDKDVIFVADAQLRPVYQFFNVLSQITGPFQTGLITCSFSGRC